MNVVFNEQEYEKQNRNYFLVVMLVLIRKVSEEAHVYKHVNYKFFVPTRK